MPSSRSGPRHTDPDSSGTSVKGCARQDVHNPSLWSFEARARSYRPGTRGANVSPSRRTRPSMWPLAGALTVTPSMPEAMSRS